MCRKGVLPLLLPLLRAQIANDCDYSSLPQQKGRGAFRDVVFCHSCQCACCHTLPHPHPSPLLHPLLFPTTSHKTTRCCSDRLQEEAPVVLPAFLKIFSFRVTSLFRCTRSLGGKMGCRAEGATEGLKKKMTEGVTGTRDKRVQLYFLFIQALVSRQREREQGLHSSLLPYLR